jgi:hypothetical protein
VRFGCTSKSGSLEQKFQNENREGEEALMAFEAESCRLGEVVVLCGKAFRDDRGSFIEVYRQDQFEELGLTGIFVQENHSCCRKGSCAACSFSWIRRWEN